MMLIKFSHGLFNLKERVSNDLIHIKYNYLCMLYNISYSQIYYLNTLN